MQNPVIRSFEFDVKEIVCANVIVAVIRAATLYSDSVTLTVEMPDMIGATYIRSAASSMYAIALP